MPKFINGYNMPGYLPDGEPGECETLEQAKAQIIHDLKTWEGETEDESEAEIYCGAAEDVNLWSGPNTTRSLPNGYVFFLAIVE